MFNDERRKIEMFQNQDDSLRTEKSFAIDDKGLGPVSVPGHKICRVPESLYSVRSDKTRRGEKEEKCQSLVTDLSNK